MYECKHCHIKVRGNVKCCPLCQGELTGTAEQNIFPIQSKNVSYRIIYYTNCCCNLCWY